MKETPAAGGGEEGFGLIEILVSMFLLALLSMYFLPVLIGSMRATVVNTTAATAAQIASAHLDELRKLSADCASISTFDDPVLSPSTDERGVVFQPYRSVGACPAAYPGVVTVNVWVTEQGDPKRLAEAVTLVHVGTP